MKLLAQELRKKSTDAEMYLWSLLRNRKFHGFKFRRQHPIGGYIVDFICHERKLVIELDGNQHKENFCYDQERTAYLEKLGYKVLRFWNNALFKETSHVLEAIYQSLQNQSRG
jgi:very-short-patch-repair endonuclease